MKRILISLAMIAVVGAVVVGGTTAFFSDTETSSGNTFTAGAIDLTVDNHSYYNGEYSEGTSWELTDLEEGVHFFFNFDDLKPGDWGEDTISLHVNNNDAWMCTDLYVTRDDDMSSTEPELEDGDAQENPQDIWDGELASAIQFMFWVDDGDNVLEDQEDILILGPASEAIQGLHFTLADYEENNLGGQDGEPVTGGSTYYIGKAWCFGTLTPTFDGVEDPTVNPGFTCDGSSANNLTQTDNVTADLSFFAVQSRNNNTFVCEGNYSPDSRTILRLENKDIDGTWDPYLNDGIRGELAFLPSHPTFDYTLEVHGLVPSTEYSLIYYADPWPGNNPGALIGTVTTDGSGDGNAAGDVELGMDLPHPSDGNYPTGAKFWVVKSSDYDAGSNSMTSWPAGVSSLFEWNLTSYDDTDV